MSGENIKFLIQEYNEHPIVGEGGLNSGIPISKQADAVKGLFYADYKSKKKNPVGNRTRYDILNANAQRTYRNRYRDDYNEQMRKLYQAKYSANAPDSQAKQERLERMRYINTNQRFKNNIYNLENQPNDKLKEMTKVKKYLKADFNKTAQKVRLKHKQRKTFIKRFGAEEGEDKYQKHLDEMKKARAKQIEVLKESFFNNADNIAKAKKIALDYELAEYKKFQDEYPYLGDKKEFTIVSEGNKKRRARIDGSPFAYAEPDYSELSLKPNSVNDLENYYDDVIANKEGRNLNNEYQLHTPEGKKYKKKSKVSELLPIHRNQLTAGEWKLDGTNPKRKIKNAKVVKVSKSEVLNDRGVKVKVKTSTPKLSDNPFTPQI